VQALLRAGGLRPEQAARRRAAAEFRCRDGGEQRGVESAARPRPRGMSIERCHPQFLRVALKRLRPRTEPEKSCEQLLISAYSRFVFRGPVLPRMGQRQ
jgi:hypothetical protein